MSLRLIPLFPVPREEPRRRFGRVLPQPARKAINGNSLESGQNIRVGRKGTRRCAPKGANCDTSQTSEAAGNEVEVSVRDYLRRMLPPRYYVTHGHLIDTTHRVSPQLDVIIADNFSLPSLLTTRDGTEYVPATSVLAIGEVKSTYYHSKRGLQELPWQIGRNLPDAPTPCRKQCISGHYRFFQHKRHSAG